MEWNGTVPYLASVLVFGWVGGTEPSSPLEWNIPFRCGIDSSGQIGRIWRNSSLTTGPHSRELINHLLPHSRQAARLEVAGGGRGGEQARWPGSSANFALWFWFHLQFCHLSDRLLPTLRVFFVTVNYDLERELSLA